MDRDELLRVLRAFESEALEYVLIGATAMGLHGVVRATEDIDLLVRATPENIERLRRAFRAVYPSDPSVEEIRSTDDTVEAEVKEVEGERRSSVPVQEVPFGGGDAGGAGPNDAGGRIRPLRASLCQISGHLVAQAPARRLQVPDHGGSAGRTGACWERG